MMKRPWLQQLAHKEMKGSLNHGFASYAAVSLVRALTGLGEIDERAQTIAWQETDCAIPCHVEIGLLNGKLTFTRQEGAVSHATPPGYRDRMP